MPRTCLHIFLSSIEHTTRLYKEAAYVLSNDLVDRVIVLGLWAEQSAEFETTSYGLEIRRKRTWSRSNRNGAVMRRLSFLRRPLALFSLMQYALSSILTARQLRPAHVCCHNAIMLPVAWAMARLSGATLEYLPHELETQRFGLKGNAKWITALVERRFIHKARNVVVVCDPIRGWYEAAYGLNNLHVVRNLPERAAVAVRPLPDGDFRSNFGVPDTATLFIYQGLFGPGRGTNLLVDVFSRLDPEQSQLVLMGYGEKAAEALVDQAARTHSNIHYQPAVEREWIVSHSAGADVGLLILEEAVLSYRYSLPNKFFEYAHAGVPMLVSDNLTYQAGLLEAGGFGWSTSLEETEETLRNLSDIDLQPFRERSRAYAETAVWELDAQAFDEVYRAP